MPINRLLPIIYGQLIGDENFLGVQHYYSGTENQCCQVHLGKARQVGLYHAQGGDVGTWSSMWTTPFSRYGQQFFPSYNQVPIDVTPRPGWPISPVHTRSPFNSGVNLINVSKVYCSRKWQHHQNVLSRNPNLHPRLGGRCPDHLAMLRITKHTHAQTTHTIKMSEIIFIV